MPREKLEPVVKEYEKPNVVDYGDLVELTAGGRDGQSLDASFPINTPKRNLTFFS